MKKLLLAAVLLALASPAARGDETREISRSLTIEPGHSIEINFSIGELRIEAGDGDQLIADVVVRCKKRSSSCREALEKAAIVSRDDGERTVIEVVGRTKTRRRKLEVEGTITVPRAAPLTVDMGIGELVIEGVDQNLTVDMGIGEVSLRLREQAVRSVLLDAGIGDAELRPSESGARARRPALIGREIYWDQGPGTAKVAVDLGIGDITVSLE